METTARPPVNQQRRINVLRALFVLVLPLILLSRPVIAPDGFSGQMIGLLGIGLVIAAVMGRLWSILYSGGAKNARVVRDGPYSICRHPLYLFSTIGIAGFGLMLGSLTLAMILTVLTGTVLAVTARKEEVYLRGHFGPDYADYAARVPMILPRLSGFQTPGEITVNVRSLRYNLMDALVFLSFIPIASSLQAIREMGLYPMFSLF